MSSLSPSDSESKVFQIKGSMDFANRSSMVFNGLNELEEKHNKWQAETPEVLGSQKPDPICPLEIMDCKNGMFKRPRLPLSLKRKRQADTVPDYVMNPHKWKRYSLADTPNVTEESNTAVALQFLKDLKKNRDAQVVPDAMEVIAYRKPTAPKDEVTDSVEQESEEPSSRAFTCSSVHRMPELVVGEKRGKPTKSSASNAKVGVSIKLDHLEEYLDDEAL